MSSKGFTILSLSEDTQIKETLSDISVHLGLEYINAVEHMDFLEDVLDYDVGVLVFHAHDKADEIYKTVELLSNDSLSKEIPIIIISDLPSNEELAFDLSAYPVVSIMTYSNWKYQLISLVKILKGQFQQRKVLHDDLQSSQEKNFIDPLTGALNRRGCERAFEQLVGYSAETHESFSLVMLDIDYFKKVNDTYGHDVGDEVLIGLSQILKHLIRKNDTLVRFGGEEFIIILSQSDEELAKKKAEEIRKVIESASLSSEKLSITASFGLAQYKSSASLEELIHEADQFLYAAKAGGRNKVCYEGSET